MTSRVGQASGTSHMIQGESVPDGDMDEDIFPSWEEEISKEDCLDGNLDMGWAFSQFMITVTINEAKNEIAWNTTDKPHHAYDQQGR